MMLISWTEKTTNSEVSGMANTHTHARTHKHTHTHTHTYSQTHMFAHTQMSTNHWKQATLILRASVVEKRIRAPGFNRQMVRKKTKRRVNRLNAWVTRNPISNTNIARLTSYWHD